MASSGGEVCGVGGELERRLLAKEPLQGDCRGEEEPPVVYAASFAEMERNFVKYQAAQWVLYSLVLILAWGIGLLMLLYLPVWIYVCRRDFQSRRLYLTRNSIVYKVSRPVFFPCFGVTRKEKYIVLPSVADVVVEQGYLQSLFGLYSIRIENSGVRRPASDDVKILGIARPCDFQKAVLTHLSNMRSEILTREASVIDDPGKCSFDPKHNSWVRPLGELALRKLEEVKILAKKLEVIVEKNVQTSASL